MRNIYILLGRLLYPLVLPLIRIVIRRTERVYIAVIYDKQVILIKNWLARDTWRLPGGGIGRGESPEAAAIREIQEELRLVLQKTRLIKVSNGVMLTDKLNYRYTCYAYCMKTFPRRLEDQYEITDYGLYNEPPTGTQQEIVDMMDLLRKQKLL